MATVAEPDVDATEIELAVRGAGGVRVLVCGLLAGLCATACVLAGLWSGLPWQTAYWHRSAVFWAFAVVFGLICVRCLLTLVKVRTSRHWRRTGLLIDSHGIWFQHRAARLLAPWNRMAGVALTYQLSADDAGDSALGRQHHALDVYPAMASEHDDIGSPFGTFRRIEEEPARPDLPHVRYRLDLPGPSAGATLEEAVRRFRPGLWNGSHQR